MASKLILVLVNVLLLEIVNGHLNLEWDPRKPAFDPRIYEDALDPELCHEQLQFIRNNTMLRLQFLEAGARFPKGFLLGNTLDMGNYHQCLGINHDAGDSVIQGKYCMINGPLNQTLIDLEEMNWSGADINDEHIYDDMKMQLTQYSERKASLDTLTGTRLRMARIPGTAFGDTQFSVAVCVPKTCTTGQGMTGLLFNVTALGLHFEDQFCRIPNDKPWVPADYIAIVVFSLIGLITLLSTGYDLYYTIILKDPKSAKTILKCFSLYTNTRRLTTFTSAPGALDCVDGIRALAMMWVIMGHTFTSQSAWSNPLDTFVFTTELSSLWITAGHLTVDTFFVLSGLLVVYTTAGKLTGMKLLKNIHLFYLNRLLRMFPVLAVGVLFEASIAHHLSDGPNWQTVATQADRCRTMWWTTLLHVQNYVSPSNVCIGQSWYLAIDVQLHILSPLVLVWVLGNKKRTAWIALIAGVLACITAATIYNIVMMFPSGMMTPGRADEMMYYMVYYYMNTLTRGSPFFVGMMFGYMLYVCKRKNIVIPKIMVGLLWLFTFVLFGVVMYATYPALQIDWDNQPVDTMINSFQRPGWALALGWMIFMCVSGYGGPVNWFLSLSMWKLPARLSYAMYIMHWSLMTVVTGSRVAPLYFTVPTVLYNFLSQFALSFMVAFIVTVFIDSPCSTIFKMLLGGGPKKSQNVVKENDAPKQETRPARRNGSVNENFVVNRNKVTKM